jgi:hypothetical protein
VLDYLGVHSARVELFLFSPGSGALAAVATGQQESRADPNDQQQPQERNKFDAFAL